jgi:hypothetical protein
MTHATRLLTGAAASAGTPQRPIFVSELNHLCMTVGLYWFDHFHRKFDNGLFHDQDLLTWSGTVTNFLWV